MDHNMATGHFPISKSHTTTEIVWNTSHTIYYLFHVHTQSNSMFVGEQLPAGEVTDNHLH